MECNLVQAKQWVSDLDQRRFERALQGSGDAFQHVLAVVPLLLHLNHPQLPGYVIHAPSGIANFLASDYQKKWLTNEYSIHYAEHKSSAQKSAVNFHEVLPPILGVYVMGSFGSISQTSSSDLDTWICVRDGLSPDEYALLTQKAKRISEWAMQFNVEINFYLMDQQRFRNEHYADPLTVENSGSAQYMLLLDEFYRSAVRLAGKPLLWLHLWVENEKDYEKEVARLITEGEIDPNDWVDFGGLGQFSANEYFGASLWHLYKGIDSPYKSVLKILLLEAYSKEYPNTCLIARTFKRDLLAGNTNPDHHFDPYIAILAKVTRYLTVLSEFKRLDFVRRCFYVKATEDFARYQTNNWRIRYMEILAQEWGWSAETVKHLNKRPFWKIKAVKENHDNVMKFLMLSYRNLVEFARKHHIHSSVVPQDINILSRKLYTAFEELPGKVSLLNTQISHNLSEAHLTFVEVRGNKHFKDGWYLINQPTHHIMFSKERVIEYGESLNKLVSWAYFNHLLTEKTKLSIFSKNVTLSTLQRFVTNLRQSFPSTIAKQPKNSDLLNQCEIRSLFIAINLTTDPTSKVEEVLTGISSRDLFSFGSLEQSLVGSIDFTYRNVWNEIRTLHFEGQNAILLALKVLSNKIYRGVNRPDSIQVYCYSERYRQDLRQLVMGLVNRCVSIQVGDIQQPCQTSRLRVAGKNWQLFFEDRGISLQEIGNESVCNEAESAVDFDEVLQTPIEDGETNQESRRYPPEMDAFASEGFLQFFFEDNSDHSFNVYILDESNHLEIYRRCDGEKDEKVREINQLYQNAKQEGDKNPYNIVQRNFNYPQFYQLKNGKSGISIVPFKFRPMNK